MKRRACLLVLTPLAFASAQQGAHEGAYVARVGGTVIAREHYRFANDTLNAQVDLVTQSMRLETRTAYDENRSPRSFHLAARGAGDTVLQELEATFADSARWSMMTSGGNRQGSATPLTPPFGVLQNLQFSHLAVVLQRYDRSRGGPQTLNLWLPQGAQSLPMTMQLAGDSGSVEVAGVTMRVTLDQTGWLRHASVPAQGLTVEWQALLEPVAKPTPGGTADTLPSPEAVESPYAARSEDLTLAGTLTVPRGAAGPVPVALIVAGSGPTDRNGNSALGLKPNSYAQLAWRLAERGIASFRYDKRGLPASRGSINLAETTFDDFIDDVVAATRELAADRRFSRVVILGHSEGAGLALLAANRGAPVVGIGMLAGLGRPFGVVLREQLAAQFDSATMVRWDSGFARYLRGEDPGELPDALQVLVVPINRRFTQTAVRYDPVKEVHGAKVPVLIVQGETDLQITVGDAQALAAAQPAAKLVLIPGANHLFKRAASRERGSQAAQYLDPTLPLVPELVEAVVSWVALLK